MQRDGRGDLGGFGGVESGFDVDVEDGLRSVGDEVVSRVAIEDVWSIIDNMMPIAFFARWSDFQLRPWSNPSTNSVFGVDIHVSRSKGSFIHVISIGDSRSGVVDMADDEGLSTLLMAQDT